MLDGAFTSPKLRRLSVILGVPWPHAIGIAGLLWRFAAKHAPSGEIGRHDDEEIAAVLEWAGGDEDLIAALVRCRLVDKVNGPARLIVHDWPDHAPRYVLATLRRRNLYFSPHYGESTAPTTAPTVVSTTESSPVSSTVGSSYASSSSSSSSSSIPSTSTSSSSSGGIDSERSVVIQQIWDLWIPGRKTGKGEGFRAINASINRVAQEFGVSEKVAAHEIAVRTRRDADRYREQLENGETEYKFVPQAVNYFKKERWLDDDERPKPAPTQGDLADRDLQRIRGTQLEGKLPAAEIPLEELDTNG